jgi:hypothetical protein
MATAGSPGIRRWNIKITKVTPNKVGMRVSRRRMIYRVNSTPPGEISAGRWRNSTPLRSKTALLQVRRGYNQLEVIE